MTLSYERLTAILTTALVVMTIEVLSYKQENETLTHESGCRSEIELTNFKVNQDDISQHRFTNERFNNKSAESIEQYLKKNYQYRF